MPVAVPRRVSFVLLQVAGWLLAFGLVVAYLSQRIENLHYVAALTTAAFLSYAVTIYGYVYGLYPWAFQRVPRWAFVTAVLAGLVGIGAGRLWLEKHVVTGLFPNDHRSFLNGNRAHVGYVAVTISFAFGFALLARSAMAGVALQRQRKELENKQLQAEMNLLKAQVQPHFLFNTLNNIYYEAYVEAPRTADLVEKLAALMRYFMEASKLERVPLSTEIGFLRNYITLEKIRFRHELQLSFCVEADEGLPVPPMLLIPLVENLFKHSFDKRRPDNSAALRLHQQPGWLLFQAVNPLPPTPAAPADLLPAGSSSGETGGFGLRNLRERLRLLYGTRFELSAGPVGPEFVTRLLIPI